MNPRDLPSTAKLKNAYRDIHTIETETGPRARRPESPSLKAWARAIAGERPSSLQRSARQWLDLKFRGDSTSRKRGGA